VIKRLRERGQPIRLFGESDAEAARRLNIIETSESDDNGMRNDFKAAMEKSEQESINEIMNSIQPNSSGTTHDVEVKEDEIDLNEIIVYFDFFIFKIFNFKQIFPIYLKRN
jgi:pre-mRNA-splicing factor 18